jgi:hypothetical protein
MMPTGYTAGVVDGSITTLREFALLSARGMGATITMRDDPHDAPIPARFEPQTKYHDEKLLAARARLAELEAMDAVAREAGCAAYNGEVEADRAKAVARNTDQLNRYNAMIAQVVAWDGAPEGLKEFMLDQLHRGRDFDCSGDPTEYMEKPLNVADWYREQFKRAARDIAYHEGERAKEIGRTAQRNAWLSKLHASLPA